MTHSERPKLRSVPVLKGSIGLFISPQGEVVEVAQSHINTVILHPEKFGITTQEIESVYAKHKEPVLVEGSGREEILCNLVMRGWIRLRRYVRPREQWSATLHLLNDRTRVLLREWAGAILAGTLGFREDDPRKPAKIVELANRRTIFNSVLEISYPAFITSETSVDDWAE